MQVPRGIPAFKALTVKGMSLRPGLGFHPTSLSTSTSTIFLRPYPSPSRFNSTRTQATVPSIRDKIHDVRCAFFKRPPFCSGIVPLNLNKSKLFYEKRDSNTSGFLCLGSATSAELQNLVEACDVDNFFGAEGEGNSKKMDVERFCTQFDPASMGTVDMVREGLLDGYNQTRKIWVELSKLNVYDEGSFIKARKDTTTTPTESPFASLVIAFPTTHAGGQLLIREWGREWLFDPTELLSESTTLAPSPAAAAAWIAFESEVEHELTPVTSGHLLTLTYNLYYQDDDNSALIHPHPHPHPKPTLLSKSVPEIHLLHSALTNLLSDNRFLPNGGYLCFELSHLYPEKFKYNTGTLQKHIVNLKGNDAVLYDVLTTHLRLSTTLEVEIMDDDDTEGIVVLLPETPDLSETTRRVGEPWGKVLSGYGAKEVYTRNKPEEGKESERIVWVTSTTRMEMQRTYGTEYVEYGIDSESEPTVGSLSGEICLIARVGPVGKRETETAVVG